MKKRIVIGTIVLIILALLLFLGFVIFKTLFFSMKAVVIDVDEHSLTVMGDGLLYVGFADEGNIGFKQGQEILIYFDGMINASDPAQISNPDKIVILKEKSDTEIPIKYLRYCFSREYNVKVSVNELTNSGITLSIIDINEIPYEYRSSYTIMKREKNKDYTEMTKISNIKSKDTVEPLVYNLPNMTENEKYTAFGWKIDWTPIYGILKERRV